jgi:DNA polymerase-3 subunit gamma/tau
LVDELIYEKVDLMNHLRSELKNFKIMLEPIIVETVQEKKLYTSKDKYQHLAAKNPKLEDFRKVFNLDLD